MFIYINKEKFNFIENKSKSLLHFLIEITHPNVNMRDIIYFNLLPIYFFQFIYYYFYILFNSYPH